MKKAAFIFLVLLLGVNLTFADEGKKYGKDLTLTKTTKVSEILENPEQYDGKRVLIEGTVINVCKKAGCWIEVAGDKDYESIIVKVNDGEIVFPVEAKGKTAVVEGEVFSVVPQPEAGCKGEGGDKECGDEEKGEKHENCKDKEVKKETPQKKYLIKGIGAVIK
jgi:hypothetical protein